jgi:alpha-glucosidase (family GH31 glycosyl hydrolase)
MFCIGFQLCRYGYNSLEKLKAAVERTVNASIPLDIQYADIDHFDKRLDFTYDPVNFKGLPEYVKELNKRGIKFIIILVSLFYSRARIQPLNLLNLK